jgi:OOP family OmpA-OmpF porin
VLVALQGRQVDVTGMQAKGYGEGVPIADNGSEAGREANRRIEFSLLAAPVAPLVLGQGPLSPVPEDPAVRALTPKPRSGTEAAAAEAAAAPDAGGPDFSADDSPSVAPAEKTLSPRPRPAG